MRHHLTVPIGVEHQNLAGLPVAHPEPAVMPSGRLAHLDPCRKQFGHTPVDALGPRFSSLDPRQPSLATNKSASRGSPGSCHRGAGGGRVRSRQRSRGKEHRRARGTMTNGHGRAGDLGERSGVAVTRWRGYGGTPYPSFCTSAVVKGFSAGRRHTECSACGRNGFVAYRFARLPSHIRSRLSAALMPNRRTCPFSSCGLTTN